MANETMKMKKLNIKMTNNDYDRWMDLRKSLHKRKHLDLIKYLMDFYLGYIEFQMKKEASDISHLKSIIKLPSAMMDQSNTVPDMNTLSAPLPSNLNTNVNCDIKNERLEAIDNNVKIKTEQTDDFEENLSTQDKNTVNQIFASKEIIKIEDEDEDVTSDRHMDEYDYIFNSDDDENIEQKDDDDYIPTSPASYGETEESDDEPPPKKHAMSFENPETVTDINSDTANFDDEENGKEEEDSINHPILVYKDCLIEIAKYVPPERCFECNNIVRLRHVIRGSKIILKWCCIHGHRNYEWHSQPKLKKNSNVGDLAICSATVISRLDYPKVRMFFKILQLPLVSRKTFFEYKRRFVVPVINATWERDVKKVNVVSHSKRNENSGEEDQKDFREERYGSDRNEDEDNFMDSDKENERGDKRLKNKKDKQKHLKRRQKERKNKSVCFDNVGSKTQNKKNNKKFKKNEYDNEELKTSKNKRSLRSGKDKIDSQVDRNIESFGDINNSQNCIDNEKLENNEDSQTIGGEEKSPNDKDTELFREIDSEEDGDEDGDEDGEKFKNEKYKEERSTLIDDKKDYKKKLDDIDYYHNKDRGQKVRKDGKKCWKLKKNKNTNHVCRSRLMDDKQYDYVPKILDDIVMAFSTKNASINLEDCSS